MKPLTTLLALAPFLALSNGTPSWGQQFRVQQPAVRQFSVDTAVSVPDRGSITLGGVSRSAEGERSLGPTRAGSNRGSARSGSSAEVRAWIHDLQAMDSLTRADFEAAVSNLEPEQRQSMAREILRERSATSVNSPRATFGRTRTLRREWELSTTGFRR